MNMQARPVRTGQFGEASPEAVARRITVESHWRADAIEPEWRLLEVTGTGTLFQRFDWVDSYVRHVAAAEGLRPLFLFGRLDGRPAFVLPLGICVSGPLSMAQWLGGTHAGYNFGLWSVEGADAVSRLDRRCLLGMLAKALPGVDGLLLQRIPREHDGTGQPLAALATMGSAVKGYSVNIDRGMEDVLTRTNGSARRRRVRSKERRLAEIGEIASGLIVDSAQAHDALDFFAEQKALRLAEQGLPNVFARPGVMEFFHDLLERSQDMREPLLQISQMRVAGKLRAVVGSGVHKGRVNLNILTLIHDETLPHSPGQLAMYRHIEESCEAGRSAFDFGVGYEGYKESWADRVHELFDAYAGFTPKGKATAAGVALKERAKSVLRRDERIWSALKSLRAKAAG